MTLLVVLVVLAVLIVLALAVYAGYLLLQVKKLRRKQQLAQEELDKQINQKRQEDNSSIQILAEGLKQDQLSLTEASIRIRGLLEILAVDDSIRQEFSAFYQLADATAHIPILAEWKKLSRKQQVAFDLERDRAEQQQKEFVLSAANRIIGRSF